MDRPFWGVKTGLSGLTWDERLAVLRVLPPRVSRPGRDEEDPLEETHPDAGPFGTPMMSDEEARLRRDRKSWRRAQLLFSLTVFTVFYAGAQWVRPDPAAPLDFLRGWVFAVPLLTILLFHEFGHYILARIHHVDTSPPYFIPVPTIIGTFGAVISIRSPIYNRKALLDIGAAGPLAGFIPSVIFLWLGYRLSSVVMVSSSTDALIFGDSLVTRLVQYLTVGPIPAGHDVLIHPMGLAGWVGLLVTFLNLIPVSSLDGGHIAYALWGRKQWKSAPWVILGLVAMGALVDWWWLQLLVFWTLLLIVMITIARMVFRNPVSLRAIWSGRILRHPPVPNEEPLDPMRRFVGWLCVLLFLACLVPVPVSLG